MFVAYRKTFKPTFADSVRSKLISFEHIPTSSYELSSSSSSSMDVGCVVVSEVRLSSISCRRLPDVAPLTHCSPVAVRPDPAAAAAHVGRTVRLRRRFTSDAGGYWVQLFTLGSVTALSCAAEPHPAYRSVGRSVGPASGSFWRCHWFLALTAAYGRTGRGQNVDGSSSVRVGGQFNTWVRLTRASVIFVNERRWWTSSSKLVVVFCTGESDRQSITTTRPSDFTYFYLRQVNQLLFRTFLGAVLTELWLWRQVINFLSRIFSSNW